MGEDGAGSDQGNSRAVTRIRVIVTQVVSCRFLAPPAPSEPVGTRYREQICRESVRLMLSNCLRAGLFHCSDAIVGTGCCQ